MSVLRNISIGKRLATILLIWIILFISFGLLAIAQMRQIGDVSRNIYRHPLQVSNAAIEARVSIIKIQRDMRDLLLAQSKEELMQRLNELEAIEQSFINNLDIIKSNTHLPETRELEQSARELFNEWGQKRHYAKGLVQEGDTGLAIEIVIDNNSKYASELERILLLIDSNARKQADILLEESNRIEGIQRNIFIIAISFVSPLFVVLFVLIINSITKPVTNLKEAMDTSANTGELSLVTLKGNNEIVEMAHYYNVLINKLKNQFWIKDTENKFNQTLSGQISLKELSDRAINFIAEKFTLEKQFSIYLIA